jgi:penicillin-binding protein 2
MGFSHLFQWRDIIIILMNLLMCLGYVGVPNENDLQNQKDDLFRTPGIKIGKLGIEKILNRELIGTPGFTRFEVNAAGRAVRTVEFVDGSKW